MLEDRELGAVVEQIAHQPQSARKRLAQAVIEHEGPRGTCPRDSPSDTSLCGGFARRTRGASLDGCRGFRARSSRALPGTTSSAAASSSGESSSTTSIARPGSSCSSRSRRRFGWRIHVWNLLDNHFHLLVETTQPELSRGMQRLNGLYAMRFNRRYDRRGHLFQNRFESRVTTDERYLETRDRLHLRQLDPSRPPRLAVARTA